MQGQWSLFSTRGGGGGGELENECEFVRGSGNILPQKILKSKGRPRTTTTRTPWYGVHASLGLSFREVWSEWNEF